MKRLLFAPLLLTLLVGCSSTDKTFIERRDDCAITTSAGKPRLWLINKYGLGVVTYEYENGEEWSISRQKLMVEAFCDFYK